jgi:hypothetical protein
MHPEGRPVGLGLEGRQGGIQAGFLSLQAGQPLPDLGRPVPLLDEPADTLEPLVHVAELSLDPVALGRQCGPPSAEATIDRLDELFDVLTAIEAGL